MFLLYYIILYDIIVYYIISYYIILYHIILYYIILFVVLFDIILYYIIICCIIILYYIHAWPDIDHQHIWYLNLVLEWTWRMVYTHFISIFDGEYMFIAILAQHFQRNPSQPMPPRYREFVVYDKQCYPEFMVTYERCLKPIAPRGRPSRR